MNCSFDYGGLCVTRIISDKSHRARRGVCEMHCESRKRKHRSGEDTRDFPWYRLYMLEDACNISLMMPAERGKEGNLDRIGHDLASETHHSHVCFSLQRARWLSFARRRYVNRQRVIILSTYFVFVSSRWLCLWGVILLLQHVQLLPISDETHTHTHIVVII